MRTSAVSGPQSYVSQAATIGLTDGVSTDGYAALTRGQAARLFLNLLRADMAGGRQLCCHPGYDGDGCHAFLFYGRCAGKRGHGFAAG